MNTLQQSLQGALFDQLLLSQPAIELEIDMYSGLTADICAQAWQIVLDSVTQAAFMEITNKEAGSIVVLNPQTGEILFQDRVKEGHPDWRKHDEIALAKAKVSWETGLPSREVQQTAPHLYRPGMTKWGGAVIEHKLVVSFSGVQAVFDEAISWSVLAWIFGICRNEMTKPDGGVMASDSSFIPEPLSYAAEFDIVGSEAEQRMASVGGWPAADEIG